MLLTTKLTKVDIRWSWLSQSIYSEGVDDANSSWFLT